MKKEMFKVEISRKGHPCGHLCKSSSDFCQWGHNIGGTFPPFVFSTKEEAEKAAEEFLDSHLSFEAKVVPAS